MHNALAWLLVVSGKISRLNPDKERLASAGRQHLEVSIPKALPPYHDHRKAPAGMDDVGRYFAARTPSKWPKTRHVSVADGISSERYEACALTTLFNVTMLNKSKQMKRRV
jgi:hypothetical protein